MRNPLSVFSLVLLGIVVVVVGAAVYLAKGSTIVVATDGDCDGRACNGMEIQGQWNGLVLAGVGGPSASQLGLTSGDGVAIIQITPDARGRVDASGVRVGDVVVAIDQRPVRNLTEARAELGKSTANAPVLLDVRRESGLVTLVVPPDPQPVTAGVQVATQPQAMAAPQHVCPRDGTLVPGPQAIASGGICPVCQGPLQVMPSVQGAAR